MNKNDLITKIASATSLTKIDVNKVVDSFVTTVTKELAKHGTVRLVGFGTFMTVRRKATVGRNPKTGAKLNIAASTQPKFRAGKGLKEAVNKK